MKAVSVFMLLSTFALLGLSVQAKDCGPWFMTPHWLARNADFESSVFVSEDIKRLTLRSVAGRGRPLFKVPLPCCEKVGPNTVFQITVSRKRTTADSDMFFGIGNVNGDVACGLYPDNFPDWTAPLATINAATGSLAYGDVSGSSTLERKMYEKVEIILKPFEKYGAVCSGVGVATGTFKYPLLLTGDTPYLVALGDGVNERYDLQYIKVERYD